MNGTVIDLTDVSFSRNGTRILSDISFTVEAGEHWALLGPNGTGQSTILGFCGARTHPTAGVVEVLGQRLGRVDMHELRRGIGHVDPRHPVRSSPREPLLLRASPKTSSRARLRIRSG